MNKRITKLKALALAFITLVIYSCGSDDEKAIPPGELKFTVDKTAILSGNSVVFTDNSTNINVRKWAFPGGNPVASTSITPEVTYTSVGAKMAYLEIEFLDGEIKVDSVEIMVSDNALADFTANTQVGLEGATISFSDNSVGTPLSYEWTFEGGSPASSTDANPQVTYASIGSFKVGLKITTDLDESMVEKENFINIIEAATSDFSAAATSIKDGESIVFTNLSENATSWEWTFEGGTPSSSTAQNPPAVTYSEVGTYSVTLVSSNDVSSAIEQKVDLITVESSVVQEPFEGTPHAIPGTIELAKFDEGGPGLAYNDADEINRFGASATLRGDTQVEVEGNPTNIGWTAAGEWLEYTVDVATAGEYTVDFVVASSPGGGVYQLQTEDGASVLADMPAFGGTGGWQTYVTQTATITLPQGEQVLRFAFIEGGMNIRTMTFTLVPGDGNLVTNFDLDFETGTFETTMGALGGAGAAQGIAEISDIRASTGTKSLRLFAEAKNSGGDQIVITTNTSASAFTFEAAKTYTISFDMYTVTAGNQGTVRLQPLAAWGENKKFFGSCCGQVVGDWDTLTWEVSGVDIPEGKFHIQLIPADDEATEVFMDNFRIEEKN